MTDPAAPEKFAVGRVPVKLARLVVLGGTYQGPNMIVGVDLEDARKLIALGYAEAVPSTLEHLPELRAQPVTHAPSEAPTPPARPGPVARKKGR